MKLTLHILSMTRSSSGCSYGFATCNKREAEQKGREWWKECNAPYTDDDGEEMIGEDAGSLIDIATYMIEGTAKNVALEACARGMVCVGDDIEGWEHSGNAKRTHIETRTYDEKGVLK